jgi:hypothetical protein
LTLSMGKIQRERKLKQKSKSRLNKERKRRQENRRIPVSDLVKRLDKLLTKRGPI